VRGEPRSRDKATGAAQYKSAGKSPGGGLGAKSWSTKMRVGRRPLLMSQRVSPREHQGERKVRSIGDTGKRYRDWWLDAPCSWVKSTHGHRPVPGRSAQEADSSQGAARTLEQEHPAPSSRTNLALRLSRASPALRSSRINIAPRRSRATLALREPHLSSTLTLSCTNFVAQKASITRIARKYYGTSAARCSCAALVEILRGARRAQTICLNCCA